VGYSIESKDGTKDGKDIPRTRTRLSFLSDRVAVIGAVEFPPFSAFEIQKELFSATDPRVRMLGCPPAAAVGLRASDKEI
jgi:hypothetical protein